MKHVLFLMAAIGGLFAIINAVSAAPFVLSWSTNDGTMDSADCIAVGDLNGDGKPDIVTADNRSLVTIFTNAGSGIFSSNASYNLGRSFGSVAIADINGDGKPDLILGGGASVVIMTNAGGGIFASNAAYPVSANPVFIVATDVNGDGKPDIISANFDGTITVFTNAGGIFHMASSFPAGFPGQGNFAVADINGDGKPDLIVPNTNTSLGEFIVFTNSGGGIFGSNAVYITGSPEGEGPYAMAAADFNNDGKMDVVSANQDGTVTVLTNAGNGVLVESQIFSGSTSYFWLQAADVDGDGYTDLVLTPQNSEFTTVFNSGSGGIFITNYLDNSGFMNTIPSTEIFTMVAADINGDGKPDVVVADSAGLYVYTNDVSAFINIGTPTNVTVIATGPSGAVANFSTVSASNWTGALTVTNTPPSGSLFPIGTTIVTASTAYFITGTVSASTNITFTVTVLDTNSPVITLLGPNPLPDFVDGYFDPGATATDLYYGNLTSSIIVSGNVNTNVPGTYMVTYSVTDPAGNTSTTNRTVDILSMPPLGVASTFGNQVALFLAPSGVTNYVLQTTTNLTTGPWVTVTNGVPISGIYVTNKGPAAFFRVQPQ